MTNKKSCIFLSVCFKMGTDISFKQTEEHQSFVLFSKMLIVAVMFKMYEGILKEIKIRHH